MRIFSLLLITLLIIPQLVFATSTPSTTPISATSTPSSGGSTSAPPENVELKNPIAGLDGLSSDEAVATIIGRIILQAMTIAGSLALVAFIVGAFIWMTSAGKSDKVQQGAKTMLYAAIGLFIIFSAYGILSQIINTIT